VKRYRKYNTVRTDMLESRIALAEAKGDTSTAQAFRRLARDIGAPIREEQIAKDKIMYQAEIRR
jgi:hypothetical protein